MTRGARGALLAAAAVALGGGRAAAQQDDTTRAAPGACAALQSLRLPDVRLTEVARRDAPARRGDPREPVRVPHCRVTGVIGKGIGFVVVLPDAWNGRLFMGGNGGFAGSINRGALAVANGGFLAVSTDTGHEGDGGSARWALDDVERQLDFAHVAVHRTVEVAKVLAKAYYGGEPRWSYFSGCSNGGRQALMEAQRYPDDFDGIVAGAPAIPWTSIGASFVKNTRASFPSARAFAAPPVTQAALDLLSARVLEACDALDGVKDGVLDDPRDCRFRLSSIAACPGATPRADCLTAAQRAAIARVYAPLTDRAGRVVYPGQPFGGESLPGGWDAWITGSDTALMRRQGEPNAQAMFAIEGARYFMSGDTTWDFARHDPLDVLAASRLMGTMLNADDPDLSRMAARKGKLILWHGWADPALNPLETIDYYERVLARDANARDHVRLFMLPGVLHCAGGNGPDDVDWLRAVQDWVERGRAPERLEAAKHARGGAVTRTRPVCTYPQRAAYAGQGSTDEAASFACKGRD